jgi:hypothetical protein
LAAARRRRQRGDGSQRDCVGAQRDFGGSLASLRQRRQLRGGSLAAAARWLGGPVEKMSFFQIVHMTKVSTQIHSSISQYDVDKVSSKKNDHNLTVGCLND